MSRQSQETMSTLSHRPIVAEARTNIYLTQYVSLQKTFHCRAKRVEL